MMMPKLVSRSHGSQLLTTTPAQHQERKRPQETTGVIPAEYPPKVKLDRLSQL